MANVQTQGFETDSWKIAPKNASSAGIHSDEEARKLGFEGGFVPGVTLYENLVVGLLKRDPEWLSHGRAEMNFRRPVYSGEEVAVSINGDTQEWSISGPGDERPRGYGMLTVDQPQPVVPAGELAAKTPDVPLGDPSQVGALMESEVEFDEERMANAAFSSGFDRSSKVVPVGLWTNPVDMLHHYFHCPMTIHFTSRVWHHSPLMEGEQLHKRGQITGFEERRGNRIVHFTAELTAGGRLVAVIAHSSVFELARANG